MKIEEVNILPADYSPEVLLNPDGVIKIKGRGMVELRKDNGSLIRILGNGDAVDADINNDGSLILVTTVRGKV